MISEKDLKEMESLTLDEKIARVEKLLTEKESPRAFELGLLLALKMAKEIQTGVELGSTTGSLVSGWTKVHSPELVEQAISLARQFFTAPEKIAARIREGIANKDA